MATLDQPEVLNVDQHSTDNGLQVDYHLFLPADLTYFDGHFPNHPILPGITQVHWVMEYAKSIGADGSFIAVEHLKFMRPIVPDTKICLSLTFSKSKTVVEFSFKSEKHKYSTGRIKLSNV